MIYRKLPPHPPKMLLRIVAAAGAGILLGISGCSSSSTSPPGLGTSPQPDDAGADANLGFGIDAGITISPEEAGGCTGFCGISPQPDDASGFPPDADGTDTGSLILPEADVPDVVGSVDSGFHGVVVRPDE